MNAFVQGIVCTLLGAILWGFSGSAMQYLLEHYHVSTLFVTIVRMLGAGTMFLLIMLATKRDILRQIRTNGDLPRFAIFGAIGLFICQITYIITIDFTNAGTATVLQCTNIVMVMVLVCAKHKRLPTVFEVGGLICAMAATYLIATGGNFRSLSIPLPGLIIGLISAASVAFYVLYPRSLFNKYGSMPVTGLGMLFGGFTAVSIWIVLALLNTVTGNYFVSWTAIPALDGMGIFMLLVIVFVGTFAAFGLNIRGIALIGGMPASMLGAAEPVSATVLAALWLGTVFSWADWVGLVLMIATIMLVAWGQNSKARVD